MEPINHGRLLEAGWAYRASDRGLFIYRDPKTGLWHTMKEALEIREAANGIAVV
jgi:hypothetical protein